MIKIKFVQFYSSLEKNKLKHFRKFAKAPYFNKGRDFSNLLANIEKYMFKDINTGKFIQMLSEKTGMKQRSIWNRLSELYIIAEQFIVINEINSNEMLFNITVSTYHLNNSSYNLFKQKINTSLNRFQSIEKSLESNHYYYQLLQQLGSYYIFQNINEPFMDNINAQVIYHSASYIINHYLHLTELLQQRKLTSSDLAAKGLNFLTDNNTENFIKTIKENYTELYSEVSFHYNIYKAFSVKSDDNYYKIAFEHFETISRSSNDPYRLLQYQLLINYCIEKTNNNQIHYYDELFRLYNRKLEEGIIQDLTVGNFPVNNFRDYIFVALQLGKLEWIKWFIEKYSNLLPENVRKDEINLSYGIVFYNEADIENALIFFNKVAGDNYIHYIDSKYYKLRIHYETENFEDAYLELDNYKHYVRSHKEIPDTFAKTYKTFIKEFSTLLNARNKNKPEDAEILANQISQKPLTPRRKWLLNKLQEIVKKQ